MGAEYPHQSAAPMKSAGIPWRPHDPRFPGGFLVALVAGSFLVVRYLQNNRIEVAEARFVSPDRDCR